MTQYKRNRMNAIKKKRLEKAGWKVGTVKEFLDMSDEDVALMELKRSLITKIKEVRNINKVTQQSLAKILESSQSRIAKLEAGGSGISLDLICRALFALGLNCDQIAKAILEKNPRNIK